MTDQASFKDGGSRVDNRCELPTILSLQALDGLSAPESRIQAVPETAEAGAPMNRDLRNCCDPYLNHASFTVSVAVPKRAQPVWAHKYKGRVGPQNYTAKQKSGDLLSAARKKTENGIALTDGT